MPADIFTNFIPSEPLQCHDLLLHLWKSLSHDSPLVILSNSKVLPGKLIVEKMISLTGKRKEAGY